MRTCASKFDQSIQMHETNNKRRKAKKKKEKRKKEREWWRDTIKTSISMASLGWWFKRHVQGNMNGPKSHTNVAPLLLYLDGIFGGER